MKRGYLTIYDEGVYETLNSSTKKKRPVSTKSTMQIPDGFILIPNFSNYLINDKGVIISKRTANIKYLKPVKRTANHHYVTIRNDDNNAVKVSVELLARQLFK